MINGDSGTGNPILFFTGAASMEPLIVINGDDTRTAGGPQNYAELQWSR